MLKYLSWIVVAWWFFTLASLPLWLWQPSPGDIPWFVRVNACTAALSAAGYIIWRHLEKPRYTSPSARSSCEVSVNGHVQCPIVGSLASDLQSTAALVEQLRVSCAHLSEAYRD